MAGKSGFNAFGDQQPVAIVRRDERERRAFDFAQHPARRMNRRLAASIRLQIGYMDAAKLVRLQIVFAAKWLAGQSRRAYHCRIRMPRARRQKPDRWREWIEV